MIEYDVIGVLAYGRDRYTLGLNVIYDSYYCLNTLFNSFPLCA